MKSHLLKNSALENVGQIDAFPGCRWGFRSICCRLILSLFSVGHFYYQRTCLRKHIF